MREIIICQRVCSFISWILYLMIHYCNVGSVVVVLKKLCEVIRRRRRVFHLFKRVLSRNFWFWKKRLFLISGLVEWKALVCGCGIFCLTFCPFTICAYVVLFLREFIWSKLRDRLSLKIFHASLFVLLEFLMKFTDLCFQYVGHSQYLREQVSCISE